VSAINPEFIMYIALLILGSLVVLAFAVAIRDTYRRPRYYPTGATRLVRPYAVVEAYDAHGNRVLPTIVYSQEQAEQAERKYADLGCCTVVRTHIDGADFTSPRTGDLVRTPLDTVH
jgi:hypothetical protein